MGSYEPDPEGTRDLEKEVSPHLNRDAVSATEASDEALLDGRMMANQAINTMRVELAGKPLDEVEQTLRRRLQGYGVEISEVRLRGLAEEISAASTATDS